MRKFRFSIGSMMILTLLTAVFLGFVVSAASSLKRVETARKAVSDTSAVFGSIGPCSPTTIERISAFVFGVELVHDEEFLRVNAESDLHLLGLLSDLPHVTEVRLTECQLTSLRHFESVETVDKVVITDCKLKNLEGIQSLDKLKCLEICGGRVESLHGLAVSQSLKSLKIEGDFTKGINGLDEIGQLKNLSELEIDSSPRVTAECFESALKLSSLRSLKLSECGELKRVDRIAQLKNLETLFLRDLDVDLNWLVGLKKLRSLILLNSYTGASDLESLSALPNLSCLELCPPGVSLTSLNGLEGLKQLKSLRLFPASGLQDISAIQSLPNLEMLDISGLALPTIDSQFRLEKLETLSLRDCPELQSLDFLVAVPRLKQIELDHCEKLTEVQSLNQCEKLNSIFVRACPLVGKFAIPPSQFSRSTSRSQVVFDSEFFREYNLVR